jgi:hypothetical protein
MSSYLVLFVLLLISMMTRYCRRQDDDSTGAEFELKTSHPGAGILSAKKKKALLTKFQRRLREI